VNIFENITTNITVHQFKTQPLFSGGATLLRQY